MPASTRATPSIYAQIKQAGHTFHEALPLLLALVQNGRPDYVLRLDGGIGDDLMCSAAIHELKKRGAKNIWMITDYPDLFRHNPHVSLVVKKNYRGVNRVLERFKLSTISFNYAPYVNDRHIPPKRHIITTLCEELKLTGEIAKRTYLYLRPEEKAKGLLGPRQIAIQSSGQSAKHAALTKEWFPARFQQIVDRFRNDFTLVQVGSSKDPALAGVVDMRGKTSIRETASILANSVLFVGLVGFLQHLARSVECRSVIVFGGRELPTQGGYGCNQNIVNNPECSPCWIYNSCEHGFKCMDAITVAMVAQAIETQLARHGQPLPVDTETV